MNVLSTSFSNSQGIQANVLYHIFLQSRPLPPYPLPPRLNYWFWHLYPYNTVYILLV